ncbi:actin binding protein, partial [Planoprotostelium fungivorum]
MSLNLKVLVEPTGQTKKMKFTADMGVGEAIVTIREKTEVGGADFGLFMPANLRETNPKWLKDNRTLAAYGLENDDEVHYRKKHKAIRVKLLDGTVKVMLFDLTLPVVDIVNMVGEKIDLANAEEYSLQWENPLPAGPRLDWLQPNKCIEEQNVKTDNVFLLKKKYFYSDANISLDDPMGLHLLFVQATDAIISGLHPVMPAEVCALAALHAQVTEGRFNPEKHVPPYLELKKYLPPALLKEKGIEKDIMKEWRKLVGTTESNAKFKYIQLCRSLKTWGITTFHCRLTERGAKAKKPPKILLGVTRDSVLFMNVETKAIDRTWELRKLRRWAASDTGKSLTLDFGNHENDYFILMTEESDAISSLLSGYIDIILKARRDAARIVDDNNEAVATEETLIQRKGMAYATTTSIFSPSMNPYASGDSSGGAAPASSFFRTNTG